MRTISQEELNKIIENHKHWLQKDCENWESMSADLSYADLRNADLSCADLSGANGILSAIDFLKEHFEFTENGIIAYKTFAGSYNPPKSVCEYLWKGLSNRNLLNSRIER